jgi:cytochrome c-type biogenesis protein CcmF
VWDPVENAALLPWLTATAFLHSVMVQERRGMLKVWNLALVVTTFALTLFGTFLTRSNIVASVHNFGAQTVGPWLLGAIVVVLAGGFYLIVTRLSHLKSANSLESYFSREAVFLYNNLLLVGLAFAVIWGTLFPVLSELVTGDKITVGRGFFDQVAAPIGFALLLLTGIGPLIPWRKASLALVRRRFLVPLAAAAVAAPLVLLSGARDSVPATAVFLIAIFTLVCIGSEFWRGAKVRHALGGVTWLGAVGQIVQRNRRRYGGYIVHVGIVVIIVGIAASRSFLSEGTFSLAKGQQASVAGYTFTAQSFERTRDPNKMSVSSTLLVTRGSNRVATLRPAKHRYLASGESGDEIAITGGLRRDIWVNLAELDEGGVATLHVFINPLVSWIWIGALLLLVGSGVAAWPSRGRRERAAAPATDEQRVSA